MTAQELAARALDLVAAWTAHDVDRIVTAHSVDVHLRDSRDALVGRGPIRAHAEETLTAARARAREPRRTLVAGNVVTLERTARWADGERRGVTVADYDAAGRICDLTR